MDNGNEINLKYKEIRTNRDINRHREGYVHIHKHSDLLLQTNSLAEINLTSNALKIKPFDSASQIQTHEIDTVTQKYTR
jgi:hypothetical protein